MPITKHELNNIHLVRERSAKYLVDKLKKHVLRDICVDTEVKTKTYLYIFALGQDLLIEKIIERLNHEFVDMVETNVIVHYDPNVNQNRMTLRITLNWEMDLNEAFIMYDSSSDEDE